MAARHESAVEVPPLQVKDGGRTTARLALASVGRRVRNNVEATQLASRGQQPAGFAVGCFGRMHLASLANSGGRGTFRN